MHLVLYGLCILVRLFPSDYFVSVPGGQAIFTCLSLGIEAEDVLWQLDDARVEPNGPYDATIEFDPLGGGTGVLQLRNVSVELNSSTIRCEVLTSAGSLVSSDESTLLLQGYRAT